MNLVPLSVSRSFSRKILLAKKNSPHIFFVGGIAGVIGSTVLACRATLKVEAALDEVKEDLDSVKEMYSDLEGKTHTEQDYYKDLGYVYLKGAKKLGKLYGPSVMLGTASIGALTGAHVQLTRRNAALTATVAAISKAYDDYRERVQEQLGEKKELELYRGVQDEEVTEAGKKKIVKAVNPHGRSPYAQVFDAFNHNWQKSAEMNRMFIDCQQRYANHLLQARGHVFLNDVYDALGFERTSAGAVVGWVRDGKDGYIDFGTYEACNADFLNELEMSIWLDFNVDGVIYDKI